MNERNMAELNFSSHTIPSFVLSRPDEEDMKTGLGLENRAKHLNVGLNTDVNTEELSHEDILSEDSEHFWEDLMEEFIQYSDSDDEEEKNCPRKEFLTLSRNGGAQHDDNEQSESVHQVGNSKDARSVSFAAASDLNELRPWSQNSDPQNEQTLPIDSSSIIYSHIRNENKTANEKRAIMTDERQKRFKERRKEDQSRSENEKYSWRITPDNLNISLNSENSNEDENNFENDVFDQLKYITEETQSQQLQRILNFAEDSAIEAKSSTFVNNFTRGIRVAHDYMGEWNRENERKKLLLKVDLSKLDKQTATKREIDMKKETVQCSRFIIGTTSPSEPTRVCAKRELHLPKITSFDTNKGNSFQIRRARKIPKSCSRLLKPSLNSHGCNSEIDLLVTKLKKLDLREHAVNLKRVQEIKTKTEQALRKSREEETLLILMKKRHEFLGAQRKKKEEMKKKDLQLRKELDKKRFELLAKLANDKARLKTNTIVKKTRNPIIWEKIHDHVLRSVTIKPRRRRLRLQLFVPSQD